LTKAKDRRLQSSAFHYDFMIPRCLLCVDLTMLCLKTQERAECESQMGFEIRSTGPKKPVDPIAGNQRASFQTLPR
jgi:hypothetical protein